MRTPSGSSAASARAVERLFSGVSPGSPAEEAGLAIDDVVVAVGGTEIDDASDLVLLALRLLAACGGDLERARARLDRAAEVAA